MKDNTVHILLVEDEPAHAALIRRAFETQPEAVRLTVARTLQEAQAHLAQAQPDLIITDLRLPDGKGIELLPANPDEATYPVIVLTSHGSEEVAVEAMKAGAQDYVVKSEETFTAMPRTVERVLTGWSHFIERKQAEQELAIRVRQQAVVAELGQRALTGVDLVTLMDDVTTLVAETLALELCKILEHIPQDNLLFLRAGVGWKAGLVGHTTVNSRTDSQAAYALLTGEPIIVKDLRTETRFSAPPLLRDHGVISGISVIIAGQKNRPFGLLGAHTTHRRTFTKDDIHFLQAVANVLATAIDRKRAEEALRESEERYRALFDNAQDAIVMADDDGHYIEANQAACDLFGYSREEFLQMTVWDLVPAARSEGSKTSWQAFIAAGQIRGEYNLLTKDGAIIQTEHQSVANIVPGLHLALIRDVTERNAAAEALRKSEQRLSLALSTAKMGTWQRNLDTNEVIWSRETEAIFGLEPGSFEGTHEAFLKLVHPDDLHLLATETTNLKKGIGINSQLEYRLIRPDGAIRWVETNLQPIQDEANHFSHVIGTILDITERKQAEKEIRRRNRELALLNRVIAASATSLEPETILETVCRELALAYEVPRAAAALLDESQTTATIVAQYAGDDAPLLVNRIVPVAGVPSFQHIIQLKEPFAIPDVQDDPHLAMVKSLLRERGVVSLLLIPIVVEDQVAGGMGLGTLTKRDFSPEEMQLAKSVADQIGGALARVQLEEERRRLAAEYQQAQKLEAVGQLAAGIAHDFNNLLTAINGFAELLYLGLGSDNPHRESAGKILQSGQRAADLVSQLLAFSRKHVIRPQVVDLTKVVIELDKMLRRIIREDVFLEITLAPDLWPVKADPAQMEQVIVNLVINACDAMPEGGQLSIQTANLTFDQDQAKDHLDLRPGDYVVLTIRDTGHGMSEDVRSRIFEPFFTTKEVGKGTGLGLATVFGIVKQNQGTIEVTSSAGAGTAFKIYMPRTRESGSPPDQLASKTEMPAGNQTILVAEDNAEVRELAQRALQEQGYTLLRAQNGEEALALAANHRGPIHLLLTDVVMPGMSGQALAEQMVRMYPGIRVLYMSGYTNEGIVTNGVLDTDVILLQKPFSPYTLAHRVRAILNDDLGNLNPAYEDRRDR